MNRRHYRPHIIDWLAGDGTEPTEIPDIISDEAWHRDCSDYLLGDTVVESLVIRHALIAAIDEGSVLNLSTLGWLIRDHFNHSPLTVDNLRSRS